MRGLDFGHIFEKSFELYVSTLFTFVQEFIIRLKYV